jgi:predicted RNA-binding Zn-ribbon protein involved in translation (DUF1610 family)
MKVRKYHKFGNRYMFQNLILFIPGVYIFWQLWKLAEARYPAVIFYGALFLFLVVGWIIWDKIRFKSFHCPQCGTKIAEPTIKHRKEDDPINYYCPTCDIEWETGLHESPGD